ncbi:hypothetical protein K493DRAFT_341160 [Basidiobolus meristosporus CBS 931.73]|uniref:Uncharacterized protein n=1 Tax=Basidiobolus meristosporus CBS 931.73 TaxID=1314790 RepID=A0A1Y1XSA5_9FUNG|nr:hypothetical protein K493DRAFT_341160 [Basidiobolus meristosporus CBS 931.73]|eukprot:ORX88631.1 hypothetical protein K493DRAFT_341160 [Basidiobolus meristosporus CBS 931.73]
MLSFKRKMSSLFDHESRLHCREFDYSQENIISQTEDFEPPGYISGANTWVTTYPEKEKRSKMFSIFERSGPGPRRPQDAQRGNTEVRPHSMHRLMEEDQWSSEGVFHSEDDETMTKSWYSKLRNTLTPAKPLRLAQRPPAYTEMKDFAFEESRVSKPGNKFRSIRRIGSFGKKR